MEESREAIFIREVLQDGRATNILAMLTGSLILATAVFSLLAAQSRVRSVRPFDRTWPPSSWASQADWSAQGDLQVAQTGTIRFLGGAAELAIPLGQQQLDLDLRLVADPPGRAIDRLSLQLVDAGGLSVTILPAAERGFEVWTGDATGSRELIAWNHSGSALSQVPGLEVQWNGQALTVGQGDQRLLEYHHIPLHSVSKLVLSAREGSPFNLTLSFR